MTVHEEDQTAIDQYVHEDQIRRHKERAEKKEREERDEELHRAIDYEDSRKEKGHD